MNKWKKFTKPPGLIGNPKQFSYHLMSLSIPPPPPPHPPSQAHYSNFIISKQWVEHFFKLLNIEIEEKSIFKTNRILSGIDK